MTTNNKVLIDSFNNTEKDDKLYSFKISEIIKLEKYLKSKIFGQDEIIDQYINYFMLNTYRNHNNDKTYEFSLISDQVELEKIISWNLLQIN